MSLKYRNGQGVETPLAGLNGTSGELVPSASYVQSGTANIPVIQAGGSENINVTFQTPMPDADYEVVVSKDNHDSSAMAWMVYGKTTTGFTVAISRVYNTASVATTFDWTAFKLITQEQIALDEQAITDIQEVIPSTATTANKLVTQSELTAAITDAINNLSALIYS